MNDWNRTRNIVLFFSRLLDVAGSATLARATANPILPHLAARCSVAGLPVNRFTADGSTIVHTTNAVSAAIRKPVSRVRAPMHGCYRDGLEGRQRGGLGMWISAKLLRSPRPSIDWGLQEKPPHPMHLAEFGERNLLVPALTPIELKGDEPSVTRANRQRAPARGHSEPGFLIRVVALEAGGVTGSWG